MKIFIICQSIFNLVCMFGFWLAFAKLSNYLRGLLGQRDRVTEMWNVGKRWDAHNQERFAEIEKELKVTSGKE